MGRILLAEDDQTMRTFLAKALERAGHDVLAVADGKEALDAFTNGDFDLLVADIVMPNLDGLELANRIKAASPDMKVMFITGFAAVALKTKDPLHKGAKVLSKPFHLRELVEQVELLLAA